MISIVQLGTVAYATGLRLQQRLVALRKEEKIGDVLLLLEHSPVITLGRNAKAANVIASPEFLAKRGVELFECDRGGDVTFHGPGQIVGYPIFDLRGFAAPEGKRKTLGAVEFVRRLEEVLIRTCADFAIATKRICGLTGVWTDSDCQSTPNSLLFRPQEGDSQNRSLRSRNPLSTAAETEDCGIVPDCAKEQNSTAVQANSRFLDYEERSVTGSFLSARNDRDGERRSDPGSYESPEAKIAAIGIHISRFVTSHGFALNANTDLSFFDLIIPCGITAKPVTSMQKELGRELDLNAVAESISRNFGTVFSSQMLWVESLDALLGRTIGVPMKTPPELRKLQGEDETRWA